MSATCPTRTLWSIIVSERIILRAERENMAGAPDNVALLLFFVFWYVGNMYYNEYNTMALKSVGGKTGGRNRPRRLPLPPNTPKFSCPALDCLKGRPLLMHHYTMRLLRAWRVFMGGWWCAQSAASSAHQV